MPKSTVGQVNDYHRQPLPKQSLASKLLHWAIAALLVAVCLVSASSWYLLWLWLS